MRQLVRRAHPTFWPWLEGYPAAGQPVPFELIALLHSSPARAGA